MSVTMRDVLHAAELRAASLVAELSGYLVLGAADRIIGGPRAVDVDDVFLDGDGSVSVAGGSACDDYDAERHLRGLLGRSLMVSRAGSPAVHRAANSPVRRGVRGLIAELEAGLIPVNRSAARRALARLHREVSRAQRTGALEQPARGAWRAAVVATAENLEEGGVHRGPSECAHERPTSADVRAALAERASSSTVAVGFASVSADNECAIEERGVSAKLSRRSAAGSVAVVTLHGDSMAAAVTTTPNEDEVEEVTRRLERRSHPNTVELGDQTEPCGIPVQVERTEPIVVPRPSARETLRSDIVAVFRRDGAELTQPIHVVDDWSRSASERSTFGDSNNLAASRSTEDGDSTRKLDTGAGASGVASFPASGARPDVQHACTTEAGDVPNQSVASPLSRLHAPQSETVAGTREACPHDHASGAMGHEAINSALGGDDEHEVLGIVLTPSPAAQPAQRGSLPMAPRVFAPRMSDVGQLVADFATSDVRSDGELCRELQELAGIDATPGNLPLAVPKTVEDLTKQSAGTADECSRVPAAKFDVSTE